MIDPRIIERKRIRLLADALADLPASYPEISFQLMAISEEFRRQCAKSLEPLINRFIQSKQPATLDEHRKLARMVDELFADERVGNDAIQRLLMTLVRRGAVQFVPSNITYKHIVAGAPALITAHRDPTGAVSGRRRVRWNPYEAPAPRRKQAVSVSRTAPIVRAALGTTDDSLIARTLDGLWDWLIERAILRPTNDPGEYQLPAGRILLKTTGPWWVCDRCGAPTIHRMTDGCEIHGCDGALVAVTAERLEQEIAASHRASRFSRPSLPLVVREHTAQLEPEQARKYQDDFNKCLVNVLSCSTTFEMGVDVGTLDAVLLRNVPPTAANYIQRAGRAGRRKQGVAHAVTYARTMPHDQYHYFQPREIVNGVVPVPVIYGSNVRLTQRHVNSFLLGRFLGDHRQHFAADNATVTEFFPNPEIAASAPSAPAAKFAQWIDKNQKMLLAEVAEIIPLKCTLDPVDAIRESSRCLYSTDPSDHQTVYHRGLVSPLLSYSREANELQDEIMRALTEKQTKRVAGLAHAKERVERLKQQVGDQRLIDFLSGLHWLPSYAFPQDVVKLTVRQETDRGIMRLQRDRELGISEYSPSSQIIADGKLLESVGINLEWREPQLKYYRFSQANRRIFIGNTLQEVVDASPNVPMRPIQFLEPLGFTTMWDAPIEQPNLFRLRPPSNTEVFLVDGADTFVDQQDVAGVKTGIRSDAMLFRGNMGKSGKGFRLCLRCGIDQDSAPGRGNAHETPWGSECRGQFQSIALAHIFQTDVLQIRFDGFPPVSETSFWFTLATALTNAACELLSIDAKDLDSTYRSQSAAEVVGELVIFDRVPGGAGHVEQIRLRLNDVLAATVQRLEQCRNPDCVIDSSCYACLRSHRNQFNWNSLKRSAPLPWLKRLLQ